MPRAQGNAPLLHTHTATKKCPPPLAPSGRFVLSTYTLGGNTHQRPHERSAAPRSPPPLRAARARSVAYPPRSLAVYLPPTQRAAVGLLRWAVQTVCLSRPTAELRCGEWRGLSDPPPDQSERKSRLELVARPAVSPAARGSANRMQCCQTVLCLNAPPCRNNKETLHVPNIEDR